ncbi:MAG TPA: hypothetical protein VIQ00_08985 [Chitinophagaceae bacterium]|nr:hypothetical protein [Hanamia sp.]
MPNTKKTHGNESDTNRKGSMADKSKGGKTSQERGRNENSKSGENSGSRESSGR